MVDNQWPTDGPPVRRMTVPVAPEPARTKPLARTAQTFKQAMAPRTKMTAEDMEAKVSTLLETRRSRRDAREPRSMRMLVRTVAASVMGLGIIGFGLGINAANEQHAADLNADRSKESSLTGAPAASPATGKDTATKLAGGLAAAQKRSDELAAAQQRFAEIAYAGNTDPGTNDGRPKSSVLKSLEHRKTLVGFFAPESLVLTDAQAYSFRTEDLLGPGRIDPRQPWFTRYEPTAGTARSVADPASYVWKTVSVTPTGTPGAMSVVWTNTDTRSGDLLAWATARYSADTKTFSTLVVNRTTRGESMQLKPETAGPGQATTKGAKA